METPATVIGIVLGKVVPKIGAIGGGGGPSCYETCRQRLDFLPLMFLTTNIRISTT
jgi:hypothetical protein